MHLEGSFYGFSGVRLNASITEARGMATWMLNDLALSRDCLLALAYAGFPSIMQLCSELPKHPEAPSPKLVPS